MAFSLGALAGLRAEPRAPVTLPRLKCLEPRPKKLPRHRREAIVEAVAGLMREAEPTAFAIEGPGRAGVRARLCLGGWPWGQADAAADDVIQAALARVGAIRPTWKQGQPEYTQDGYAPRTRERCARCAKPLPEENYRYCGPVCAMAAKVDRNRRHDQEEAYAREKLARLAYAEKQQPRPCKLCGASFKPKRAREQYCSPACGRAAKEKAFSSARGLRGRKMRMVCEAVRADPLD